MRTLSLTLFTTATIVLAGGLGFVFSGLYNVAATDHHPPSPTG
jgi:hypothetical protein